MADLTRSMPRTQMSMPRTLVGQIQCYRPTTSRYVTNTAKVKRSSGCKSPTGCMLLYKRTLLEENLPFEAIAAKS
jgi:hypothetical protein